MDEEPTNPAAAQPRDAIDVDDLVFAATGRRLRRLTLPDGSHWFPVTDLGVTECDSAASRGVPGARRDTLANLTGRFGVAAATGPGWTGTTELVDLSVVMMLALAGGTGAGADPFRIWVADVLTAVQRDGCHFLDEATVQPRGEEPGTGYAMPSRLAEAVVRLEESSVPQDAAFAEEPATGTAAADGSRNGEPHQDPRPDLRPSAAGGDFADPAESRATPASAAAGPPADRPPSASDAARHGAAPARRAADGASEESAAGLVPAPRAPRDAAPDAKPGSVTPRLPGARDPQRPDPRSEPGQPPRPGPGRRYDRRRAVRRAADEAEPRAAGAPTEQLRDATGALRDLVAAQERSSRALARIAEAMERFSGRSAAAEDPFCRTAGTPRVPFRGWSPAPLRHLVPPSAPQPRPTTGATAPAASTAPLASTAPPAAAPSGGPQAAVAPSGQLTPEARRLFTRWRTRLTVTDDIWTVARVLAEDLAEHGEARRSTAELARLCHLSERRVADSVLFLLRRNAIRKAGTTFDGTTVYVLSR